MSTTVHVCPECLGPRLVDHPAGLIVQHEPSCSLLAAEDATQHADAQRAMAQALPGFWRRTTAAERTLLVSWGAPNTTMLDMVECLWITTTVRRRRWHGIVLDDLPGPTVEQPGDAEPDEPGDAEPTADAA